MTTQEKIDEIVSGWPSLGYAQKIRIFEESLHPMVAANKSVPIKTIKSKGDPMLRQTLPNVLGDFTDAELDDVYNKFIEVK